MNKKQQQILDWVKTETVSFSSAELRYEKRLAAGFRHANIYY